MSAWLHEVGRFRPADCHNLESVFTQSNGYLGIRGYEEEGVSGAGSDPMQFVAGYFDRSPVTRNTMVNLPTMRRIRITLDGEALDPGTGKVRNFSRELDFRNAVTTRAYEWTSPRGRRTKIRFVSFLSYQRRHLHLTEITIQPLNWSGHITLEDIFDGSGLTLGQKHFDVTGHGDCDAGHSCEIITKTSRMHAVLASVWETSVAGVDYGASGRNDAIVAKTITCHAQQGKTLRLRRYAAVATHFDLDAGKQDIRRRTLGYIRQGMKIGWTALKKEQAATWKKLWEDADVRIDGDPVREFRLRFSIFQMLQAYRPGDPRLSIGAKFLSGQHYSGHYFWDTDNFLTPFYLFTMPGAAQDLVEYRVRNLDGARHKARSKKFPGAFYPWEACPLDGRENCPEWWQDKAASAPVAIPCGSIELHINAAVAMSAWNYMHVAGRPKPPLAQIRRMLVEIARFWAGRGVWEGGSYAIKNVIGPDEYHEHVDDNAYTNHTAAWCIRKALDIAKSSGAPDVSAKEIRSWEKILQRLNYGHDTGRGILAQDRTFLSLDEIDRSRFRPVVPLFRQISMEEIGRLQAIKQADVLALFHLLPYDYDYALMQRCWDYYEPRTIHDSNLSAGSHAVVAALLGRRPEFRKYYDKVLALDIGGESYNVEDGLHAANAGNAWSATIMGAAGIRWTDSELCCVPQLLDGWKSIRFGLHYRGRRLEFRITPKSLTVSTANGPAVRMLVAGRRITLGRGARTVRVPTDPLAVVFDLDGVLVDSAVCHYAAWKQIADELGVAFDEKKNDLLRGVSRRESLMILLEGQRELDEKQIEKYLHRKNEIYKQLVNNAGEQLLLPGVKPFLSRLRTAGVRLAVASSSKNTPGLMRQAGLDRFYFDAVADGNDIKNSKPHPEVFLLAARRLGIRPSRCLCVEDAPAGIESGRRAGMKTLGLGPADLEGCDWRRESIAGLAPGEIFDFLAAL